MASDFTQLQQAIRLLNAHTRAADEQAWQVLFDRWLATLKLAGKCKQFGLIMPN